jgi:hypothetical protein
MLLILAVAFTTSARSRRERFRSRYHKRRDVGEYIPLLEYYGPPPKSEPPAAPSAAGPSQPLRSGPASVSFSGPGASGAGGGPPSAEAMELYRSGRRQYERGQAIWKSTGGVGDGLAEAVVHFEAAKRDLKAAQDVAPDYMPVQDLLEKCNQRIYHSKKQQAANFRR